MVINKEWISNRNFPQSPLGHLKCLLSPVGSKVLGSVEQLAQRGSPGNSCSLKAWEVTKVELASWRREDGVGAGGYSEVERWVGVGCFPDSFQRTEVDVLCCGPKNSARLLQILLYRVRSLAHSFRLNKVSSFPVSWSLITRAWGLLAPRLCMEWKEERREGGLVILEMFPDFYHTRGNPSSVQRELRFSFQSRGVIDCLSFKGLMEEVRDLEREEAGKGKEERGRFMASCITAFMSHNYSQHWKFMTRWETALEYRAVICMQRGNYTVPASALPAAESILSLWWAQVPVAAGHELDHPASLIPCWGWLTMLFIKHCFSKQTFLLPFCLCPLHSQCGSLGHLISCWRTLH